MQYCGVDDRMHSYAAGAMHCVRALVEPRTIWVPNNFSSVLFESS